MNVGSGRDPNSEFDAYEPHATAVDLVNSFYQFARADLAEYISLDLMRTAGDVGIDRVFDATAGEWVNVDTTNVFAALCTLPMGWDLRELMPRAVCSGTCCVVVVKWMVSDWQSEW